MEEDFFLRLHWNLADVEFTTVDATWGALSGQAGSVIRLTMAPLTATA
jgi:hypothetical protein